MHKKENNYNEHLKGETSTAQTNRGIFTEQIRKRVNSGRVNNGNGEENQPGKKPRGQKHSHNDLGVPIGANFVVVADACQEQKEVAYVVQEHHGRSDRVLVDQVLVRYKDYSHHVVQQHFVISRFTFLRYVHQ